MKPGIILIIGLLMVGSVQLHAQGKTIQVPNIKILKPGSNPIGILDSIRFSVTVSNGKLAALTAKSANGQNLPVFYRSTARIAQSGGTSLEEECQACVQVKDDDGNIQVRCYDINCDDAVQLKPVLVHPDLVISFPKAPSTGSYTLYKSNLLELKGSYTNGQLTKITGISFKNEKIDVETFSGNEGSHARAKGSSAKCFILITRTLPDGSTIKTTTEIPCKNLPKPKDHSTN